MKKQRNQESAIRRAVSGLNYTGAAYLSDEVFERTLSELNGIFETYGYAGTFAELYAQWPVRKALPFFERMKPQMRKPGEIRTVATIYHRGYNGGIERVQAQLMSLWVEMGYHVVFFAEEAENPLDFPYPDTVKRILIPRADRIPERFAALEKGIREENVDVLVNHNWGNSAVLWEDMLANLLGASYINYIHAFFAWAIPCGIHAIYIPRICRMCDAVVALSETNARFFQLCGCNTYLVENPVPEDLYQAAECAPLASRHVLLIGRISAEKYPMEAMRVFKRVHDAFPDAVLDVVGADNGNNVEAMTQYCTENDLLDAVVFHGPQNHDAANRFFHDSACMLFTSKMEGYPMVLLEAKAHGLPVAMYDLSFLTLVKGRKGILTAPVGDIDGVAENVIRLLGDDEFRRECGRAAREDFELHAAYDLRQAWTDIFALCRREKVVSQAWYDPADVPEADRVIEPMLLEAVEKAYENLLNQSLDYRIGSKVLRLPRAIKRMLSKWKGAVMGS